MILSDLILGTVSNSAFSCFSWVFFMFQLIRRGVARLSCDVLRTVSSLLLAVKVHLGLSAAGRF